MRSLQEASFGLNRDAWADSMKILLLSHELQDGKESPPKVFRLGRGALDQRPGDLVEVKPLEFLWGNGLGDQSVHGALDMPL